MNNQLNMENFFNNQEMMYDKPPIASFGEPHMACALLLDVSGSMYGDPIMNLNVGVQRFKEQIMKDPIAVKRVDIAIIAFSSDVQVVCDFCPVSQMPTPVLKAGGMTNTAAAVNTAIDMVKRRTQFYSSLGTPAHKPWIFMITDGESTSSESDMADAANRIHEEENKGSHGHLSFWALGLGDYNSDEMFKLTRRVIELKNYNFTNIFDWLSESMSAISKSHVGEQMAFSDLPPDTRKAVPDRKVDEDWY